ncbi:MAG: deoxyribonuclease IV [Breznakia sp.]
MIIGSHVSMSAPAYVYGSVCDAISYGANALMIYSGAPQNTKRQAITKLKIIEAQALMKKHNIAMEHMIVHAPYIINLANAVKPEIFTLGVDFLRQEIDRVHAIGAKYLVLHPGSHVKAGETIGLKKVIKGLNIAMQNMRHVNIALETMAGKGSELGYSFEQLRYIIDHCEKKEHLRVCMDTCHMHDAGYDLHDFDTLLDEFDRIVGLHRLACIHVNDSKNVQGSRKDRHANIGHGEIGFSTLCAIVNNERIAHVVKILETPYIHKIPPYKEEISMLKKQKFLDITK